MTTNCSIKAATGLTQTITTLLKPYQQRFELVIKANLSHFGEQGIMREACAYALLNGGRRIRPSIVFMVAEALARGADVSYAALGAEYIHTASLIADDLPCMDDDDERRSKPAVHKVYGEAVALLASYALIAAGNSCIPACVAAISAAPKPVSDVDANLLGILALDNAATNTGVLGTTGGQFLDIYPPDLSLETLREAIHKKTVSLFEVSFVFGWLFGGGHPDTLPLVKQCASHFGMAFQIADDIDDVEQDAKNDRKVNIAGVFGVEAAHTMFHEEIQAYFKTLATLNIASNELITLARCLEEQVNSLH